MADNKKEVERAELHRTIWAIADEMRGSVDGWDFRGCNLNCVKQGILPRPLNSSRRTLRSR